MDCAKRVISPRSVERMSTSAKCNSFDKEGLANPDPRERTSHVTQTCQPTASANTNRTEFNSPTDALVEGGLKRQNRAVISQAGKSIGDKLAETEL